MSSGGRHGKDAPQLLGRGAIWGDVSQLNDVKPKTYSSSLQFSLSKETTAELNIRALKSALLEFKKVYEQALSPQIFVVNGIPTATSDGLIKMARANHIPQPSLGPPRDRIPSVEEYKVAFPISRFKKNSDGMYQVGADLWNRMPIAVHGSLHRTPSRLEETATVKRNYKLDIIEFDLKAGEKKTVAFKVEPHPDLTATMLRNNTIVADWITLGERKRDTE